MFEHKKSTCRFENMIVQRDISTSLLPSYRGMKDNAKCNKGKTCNMISKCSEQKREKNSENDNNPFRNYNRVKK